ncbi:MAG: hypothetical protein MPK62_14195, partial [Alphaproteobacteria bacterium]|nr:hypothetical protein [Alphaproteobacteria bacterium]
DVYKRQDLVPSNRTGWFLTIENNLQYAINIEKGVVIERIDCREISLGRRQAQGSNPLVIDARESDFLRNQRICNVNTGATTYYWSGNRDLPQAGETVFTSNFENIVATPNRFIVFQDGSFVQLDANSVVTADGIRSCSTPQCTSDVESLFSIDDINENVLSTINTDGGALLGTNIVAFDRTTSIAARTDNVAQIYQREIGPTVETIVPTDANTRWDRQTVGDNNRYEWIIILPTNSNIFDLLRNNERVGGAGRNLLIFRDQSNWALLTLNVAVQSVVGDAVIARMSVEESKGVVGNTLNLYIDTANNRVTEALMSSDYTPVFRGINVGSRFLPIRGAEIRWFVPVSYTHL